ncbi:hypothetical protein X801_03994 [Opisthorchis viverrini]|nr:hypothetical protein X801_03994 [Opisthorchis viverrini]
MPKDQLVFLQLSSEVGIQRLKINCKKMRGGREPVLLSDDGRLVQLNASGASISIQIEEDTCSTKDYGSLLITIRTKQPTLLPIRDARFFHGKDSSASVSLEVGTVCYGGIDPEEPAFIEKLQEEQDDFTEFPLNDGTSASATLVNRQPRWDTLSKLFTS